MSNNTFQELTNQLKKITDIGHAAAVLSWDQEVYMPEKGAGFRGQQLATISEIIHELATSEKLKNIVDTLSADKTLSFEEQRDVQWTKEDLEKATKFSADFVRKKSLAITDAFVHWDKAKKASDFSIYLPYLEEIVKIVREEAKIIGYEKHPYDSLIHQYEPGMTVEKLDVLFSEMKPVLKEILLQISTAAQVDRTCLEQSFEKEKQLELTRNIVEKLGFDFTAGRQDLSSHPFCTTFSPTDVRLTTRVDENDLANAVWSSIHECGHGLYEQGLPETYYGLPRSQAVSLGIHESQSRLWENNVARSFAFMQGFYNLFQKAFPSQLKDVSAELFFKAVNQVKSSLIRTEADEITYHFHIMIRYEIEKELVAGTLAVKDVREKWNQLYKEYLGIDVPSDAEGVLQDVHWAHAGIGYFPTYSLGSFYAAQFKAKAEKDIPKLPTEVASGNTTNLLKWLRTNVHQYGKTYLPEELCTKATGEPLNVQYFLQYIRNKYSKVYGISL